MTSDDGSGTACWPVTFVPASVPNSNRNAVIVESGGHAGDAQIEGGYSRHERVVVCICDRGIGGRVGVTSVRSANQRSVAGGVANAGNFDAKPCRGGVPFVGATMGVVGVPVSVYAPGFLLVTVR